MARAEELASRVRVAVGGVYSELLAASTSAIIFGAASAFEDKQHESARREPRSPELS